MTDPINPSYYRSDTGELIDFIEHIPYNRGAAVKYLIRAGEKNSETKLEDLRKALWYVQREIDRITPKALPF